MEAVIPGKQDHLLMLLRHEESRCFVIKHFLLIQDTGSADNIELHCRVYFFLLFRIPTFSVNQNVTRTIYVSRRAAII